MEVYNLYIMNVFFTYTIHCIKNKNYIKLLYLLLKYKLATLTHTFDFYLMYNFILNTFSNGTLLLFYYSSFSV